MTLTSVDYKNIANEINERIDWEDDDYTGCVGTKDGEIEYEKDDELLLITYELSIWGSYYTEEDGTWFDESSRELSVESVDCHNWDGEETASNFDTETLKSYIF